jgi:RNA polymerase sigma-70 factor, ECF subfamily
MGPVGYFREVDLGSSFAPFAVCKEHFGFIPNLFRAQTLLPRVIEAEAGIAAAVLLKEQALSRIQKECMLLALAAAHRNTYCVTAHYQMLRLLGVPERQLDRIITDYRQADLSPADTALLDLALKLGKHGPWVSRDDVTGPFALGFTDESMLEAVLITGLTNFLCTLATGLGATPDFEPMQIPTTGPAPSPGAHSPQMGKESSGPYLKAVERSSDDFVPFAFFREKFGFIPNIFRAQTLRPDVLEAESGVIRAVLLTEDLLTRVQKESILLVISAANLNTYCVAVHCEMLRAMGVSAEDSDQIAVDHHQAPLPEADKALLDFALKLAVRPAEFRRADMDPLVHHGFREEQILEAVVMTSLTTFLNTLQMGLGTTPDFAPRRTFQPVEPKKVHLLASDQRHTEASLRVDQDAEFVARVQRGDLDAFEELMNRHSQRVYRTLISILGNSEEARDAMQDTFLKAFQHLGDFEGRSKFSTWLVSIAGNTGIQRLRERKNVESLDDGDEDEGFRPRQVRAWTDNPEQVYGKMEMRALVENGLRQLPPKYRVVLVLRDIEQLSTEEAAEALGLGIPALKARLIRGRLMLREALSPHFARGALGVTS